MNTQEAITFLKETIAGCKFTKDKQLREVCEISISALEKQIPKKATEKTTNRGIDISGEYDIDFDLCCPICGAVVGTFEEGENEYFVKCCDNCGQALDWSDT